MGGHFSWLLELYLHPDDAALLAMDFAFDFATCDYVPSRCAAFDGLSAKQNLSDDLSGLISDTRVVCIRHQIAMSYTC